MDRAKVLSESLKRFDPKLYCERNREGKLCVFRTSTRWESFGLEDGSYLTVARSTPYMILPLTHNWRPTGEPVDWGYMPITQRLREIDLQRRDIASDIEANQLRIAQEKDRHQKNLIRDGLRDRHSAIKKAFSDVRTCNMSKTDPRLKKGKSKCQL